MTSSLLKMPLASRFKTGFQSPQLRRLFLLVAILLLGIAYSLTGIYIVATDELGVIRRFGKINRENIVPGVHLAFPYPIDQVDTPKATQVKQKGLGEELTQYREGDATTIHQFEVLTGDTNILNLQLKIQYAVDQPAKYLFTAQNPDLIVERLAESVLTEQVTSMGVDEVLTDGKFSIQERVKNQLETLVKQYQLGIQLIAVNLHAVDPPVEVIKAFNDVASAKSDHQRLINEAEGKRGEVLPIARADAHQQIEAALGYAVQVVNEALGDASRFETLLHEYSKSKSVTKSRLYLETMERVLPRVKKYILPKEPKGKNQYRIYR